MYCVSTQTYTNKNELRESGHSCYYTFERAIEELKSSVNYHIKINKFNNSILIETEYLEDRVVHYYANNFRIEHTISIQESNQETFTNLKFSM